MFKITHKRNEKVRLYTVILSQTKEYLKLADELYKVYTNLVEEDEERSITGKLVAPTSINYLPFVIKRYDGDKTFSSFLHSVPIGDNEFIISGPHVFVFEYRLFFVN